MGEPEVRLPRFRARGRSRRTHREGQEEGDRGAGRAKRFSQASDITVVKTRVHDVLQKFLHKEVGRRPMVLPVIVEV